MYSSFLKKITVLNLVWASTKNFLVRYPSPQNIGYFWNHGSLAGLFLGVQIVTGLFLTMYYTPNVLLAFSSVDHIMKNVSYGWLVRYLHANGASFFFFFYIHTYV